MYQYKKFTSKSLLQGLNHKEVNSSTRNAETRSCNIFACRKLIFYAQTGCGMRGEEENDNCCYVITYMNSVSTYLSISSELPGDEV